MGDAGRLRRVVGERRVLADAVDDVGPEPVDAPVEPESQRVEHGRLDGRLVPVEVRLGGLEQVQIPLSGRLVERPRRCRQVEGGHPVVRGRAVRLGVAPHVPVAVGAVPGRCGVDEPRVLVGGVIGYPVDDHPQAQAVGVLHQRVEGGQVAEERVDVAVVAHVVAEVGHGGAEERGDPQRIDAEPDEVGEVGSDAVQVTDAVAVGVGERARVHLVEDGPPPPGDVVDRRRHSGACGQPVPAGSVGRGCMA